ncbi:restriction endonuclease subunit S [Acinetobacter johnsonii]|uniref:restriction endonuclease subunit S n=1 Tax=Acinetobacter johnsonii TaxID=40214 RepID=UPI0032B4E024
MSSTLRLFWEAAGGNVPEHWEFKTIDELLEHPKAISVGVMYPGSDSDGGVPLIKVSDVKSGAIASRPSFCISNKVDEEYKRTRLNGSELLLTLVGNPGDCVIVTDEMCGWNVARALAVIRLKDTQLRSWIRYVLASKPAQHLIEARLNTTVQKTLNLKDVREIGIPIPPKEERDSITKTIDSIEKKTLINTKINQTLESIAQAIFKSWFIDFDPVRAKIAAKQEGKDPEFAAMCAISGKSEVEIQQMSDDDFIELQATAALFPDELVESELGEVPKGWNITKIATVTASIFSGGTPSTKEETYWNGEIPWLSSGETRNKFIVSTEKSITETAVKKSSTKLAFFGDILIASAGQGHTRGQTSFNAIECYINQSIVALRANDKVSPYWLYYCLEPRYDEMRSLSDSHSSRGSLTTKLLASMPVILPTKKLVVSFDKVIKSMLTQQVKNLKETKILKETRDALIPKLLSGDLDISDLVSETEYEYSAE